MRNRIPYLLLALSLLASCAAVEKKGILVDVDAGSPVDESDLRQHCDLGDEAACALAGLRDVRLPDPRFSLVQGVAPADRAVFAALVPKATPLYWFLYDPELTQLTKLFTVKPLSRGDSRWALQRIDVHGLLPGRTYQLLVGNPEGQMLDARKFRTLDADAKNVRIALLGGSRLAAMSARKELFDRALAGNPQMIVFMGSTVNVDLPAKSTGLKGKLASDYFFGRHAEARATFGLGLARDLVPVTALWNDDEFGHADGDRSFAQHDQAREQLELFFPHWADEAKIVDGPGSSLAFELRRQNLILLDDLSFREAPMEGEPVCQKAKGRKKEVCHRGPRIPAPPGSRYGVLQRNWVSDRARKADHPLWLLAGGPLLLPFSAEWGEDKALDSPTLTRPPRQPWLQWLESNGRGELSLRAN